MRAFRENAVGAIRGCQRRLALFIELCPGQLAAIVLCLNSGSTFWFILNEMNNTTKYLEAAPKKPPIGAKGIIPGRRYVVASRRSSSRIPVRMLSFSELSCPSHEPQKVLLRSPVSCS